MSYKIIPYSTKPNKTLSLSLSASSHYSLPLLPYSSSFTSASNTGPRKQKIGESIEKYLLYKQGKFQTQILYSLTNFITKLGRRCARKSESAQLGREKLVVSQD